MQNSARWVLPVMSVSRWRSARSVTHGRARPLRVSRAISANAISSSYSASARPSSTRGACEVVPTNRPGEQVRQRRVPLPVGQQRHQQVGPAQQRRVGRGDAAQRDVVAAAGAAVGAVDVERLGGQPGLAGLLVERLQLLALLGESGGRRHVDLDDAGVRGDRHRLAAAGPTAGRSPRSPPGSRPWRRGLHPGDQVDEVFELLGGRQEDVQQPVANLGDHRGGGRVSASSTAASAVSASASPGRRASGSAVERWARRAPADRVQRQPQPGRRIAVQQHDSAAAQPPVGTGPAGVVVAAVQRQHVGGRVDDRLVEAGEQRRARRGTVVLQIVVGRRPDRPPAGGPWRPVGRADPRRPAAPGWRAARVRRRSPRAPAARRLGSTSRSSSAHGSASSASSLHSGWPSARQCSPICQRGNGSPGYHLPWLRCTRPSGAHTAFSRAASSEARSRLCGPSASVIHSSSTWLSTETNVGSPPTVSRTSASASRSSTSAPRSQIVAHAASV